MARSRLWLGWEAKDAAVWTMMGDGDVDEAGDAYGEDE
jgi:hypothetical protein